MKGSGDLFDEDAQTEFAEILLPVPIPRFFTYRIPKALVGKTMAGQRVIVPFGQKKILTGVVVTVHGQPPKDYEAKYILELLDETEVIYPQQFKLYQWIADYYLCTLGEVLAAALPSGLKLSSESMVQLHPAFNEAETNFDFSERERMVINHLKNDTMTYSQVAKLLGAKSIYSILKSLASKSAILLFEQVREKFRPKTEKHVRLQPQWVEKKKLESLFDSLAAKPKQEAVMLKYLQHVAVFAHPELNQKGVAKSTLVDEEISVSSLGTLIKNSVMEEFDVVVPRFGFDDPTHTTPLLLSEKQEAARNEILHAFENERVALLHGVTGSGKTEIYIDLIKRALEGGNQVLYLLPEIAITTQVVQRLKKVFGSMMGVYHSKFSDNERVEVWNGVLAGKFRFVVGVRSSVFLPFDNLGLIIVDEEHDPSYKQHEPAPRYHARDVALVMAQIHHARVLLGSATPSVESFYQTQVGKYKLVTLLERFGEAQLPEILFANLSQERKNKTLKGEFSKLLVSEMAEAIAKKEQVILFQNRRGYSPMVQCEDCGWVPKCINCAVSLTYHQYRHAMVCHYCGYKEELPSQCPTCTSKRIQTLGYGTEKLEEELKLQFAETNVMRMDLDTTRSKSGYENIIEGFETGRTDILVGTQMVTKGLDFDRVSLVGVFDADRMMHFPDFRSYERAFQLITQVSGRAGRRNKKGKVVIQTSNPEHPLFKQILKNDVLGFLEEQMRDRQEHFYPPFARLIEMTFKHTDKKLVRSMAEEFAAAAKQVITNTRILGPAEPMISKIRNEFLLSIAIKIARDQGKLGETKAYLSQAVEVLKSKKEYRNVRVVFDVDPA
ncbi:MAG: primosomal protein N' [Bacteroidota bacterium]|jgi:primosomal protein N' (replication factor Y)|nr:primosomal protein N' [Cytophagales bacterium]MCZ8071219.1 primosomal protein N' [Cytophagales bacterium]